MSVNDEAAQQARARELREQIKRIKSPNEAVQPQATDGASPKSPREFIQDKMRELDKGEHP